MQTNLIPVHQQSPEGARAEQILRTCVHCGFCNATCPTYQVLGDELDGPRGRIYQIKQILEGGEVSERTREHLDRCLTCRACETTCPSGVKYHELLDIGKQIIAQESPRSGFERWKRKSVHAWLIRPWLFYISMKLGRWVRPLLPRRLKAKLPPLKQVELEIPPETASLEKPLKTDSKGTVFIFGACVQDAITPQINVATTQVLEYLGYSVEVLRDTCCGALSQHTDEPALARKLAKSNIDDWLKRIGQSGAKAIVANASGCGVFIKDYPELFDQHDEYHARAIELAALCRDPVELMLEEESVSTLKSLGFDLAPQKVAYHPPCTLQHGQKLAGSVESLFSQLGIQLMLPRDSHLCCGSAGSYALLQQTLSNQLRENKLSCLSELEPELILSANVGCQSHLAGESSVPVVHWLQFLAKHVLKPRKL